LNSHLPDLAQRQLDALRAAVDVRLSALEAALADPARAGSLEALVLDLARVATEEAQAAASKACVDTKLDLDTQMARARASAQAVLQQERTVAAELRRAIEQGRQQIAALESDKQTEIRNLRASFEAQAVREREKAAGLERALSEAQTRLEAERRAAGDVRRAVEDAKKVLEGAQADVAREQEKASSLERTLAEARSQLDAERRAAEELRHVVEDVKKLSTALAQEKARVLELEQSLADLRRSVEAARADVAREQQRAGDLEQTLAEAQSQIESERRAAEQLRSAVEDTKKVSAVSLAAAKRSLEEAQADVAREREKAGGLERTLAEAQSLLDAERRVAEDLRHAVDDAKELSTALAQEKTQGVELGQSLAGLKRLLDGARADLAREREKASGLERTLADAQSQVDAERRVAEELRRAVEHAQELSESLAQEKARGVELGQSLAGAEQLLEGARADALRGHETAGSLERTLTETQSQLEFERAASLELRQAADRVAERLTTIGPEIARILEAQDALSMALAAERDKRADLQRAYDGVWAELEAARPGLDTFAGERPAPYLSSHVDPVNPWAAAPAPDSHEEWTTVRLADRFAFHEPIEIQINSEPGLLFDLSVAGCQLVSQSTLKPNQAVKVALPYGDTSITCSGKVVWARLETAGYRAGLRFKEPDEAAIEAFVAERSQVL
jgi:chromosome segregation ATPase